MHGLNADIFIGQKLIMQTKNSYLKNLDERKSPSTDGYVTYGRGKTFDGLYDLQFFRSLPYMLYPLFDEHALKSMAKDSITYGPSRSIIN